MKLTGIIEETFGSRYIFRGFATFESLVKFSAPNPNYQRKADAERIKNLSNFLTGDNPYKFFTELLFGLEFQDERAITALRENHITTIKLSDNIKLSEVKLKNAATKLAPFDNIPSIQKIVCLEFDDDAKKLTRIDGNHRLTAAESILSLESNEENDRLKETIAKTVVPFSILMQGRNNRAEDYEAAIFYLINSNSVPLTREQNLKALLAKDRFEPSALRNIFNIKNANLMLEIVDNLNQDEFAKPLKILQENYYTCIHQIVSALNRLEHMPSIDVIVRAFYKVLQDVIDNNRLKDCKNVNVIAAMIYYVCTTDIYQQFVTWLQATKIYEMEEIQTETIISLFDKVRNSKIKVFVAMPYYSNDIVRSTNKIYADVIDKIKIKYGVDISLPGGIMANEGSTFNIINDVFDRIDKCDIFFADITDNNPNVTYEMGWARALKKHVILLKEEKADDPKSDYNLDFYSTFKKDAHITLEEAIEKNLKAVLKKYYSVVIDED